MPESVKERLARKSSESESGCYIWEGHLDSGGYGVVGAYYKIHKAHRLAWMEYRGPIPIGIDVLHKCDIPACWNPEHLFLGDHSDNMQDMYDKGRGPNIYGANNGNAKLAESEVIQILTLLDENVLTQKEIALQFRVAQTTISNIKRQGWSKLKDQINAGI